MKAFWHESGNFGDELTPYILHKLTSDNIEYCDDDSIERYIIMGSVLNSNLLNTKIWGVGIPTKDTVINCSPKKIFSVRGYCTLKIKFNKSEFIKSSPLKCRHENNLFLSHPSSANTYIKNFFNLKSIQTWLMYQTHKILYLFIFLNVLGTA